MQLSADVNTYRDALLFRNGKHVKLQELSEGQRVTVLDLGGKGNEEDLSQDRAAFDQIWVRQRGVRDERGLRL